MESGEPARERRGLHYAVLGGIVLLAIALRAAFFFGFGLNADDVIYSGMSNELERRGWAAVDFRYGVNYRLGVSVPVALLFHGFGVGDAPYVAAPFLCSIASIVLVFLLGRRLFGGAAGLAAAFLMATSPFDAVFATTMTIDILTSCLTAAAVLAFLATRDASRGRALVWSAGGAVSIFAAYMVKEPALYILPCLGVLTLLRIRDRRVLRRDLVFYAATGVLLAGTVVVDWVATGDPLNRLAVQLHQSGSAFGRVRDVLLEYPRWLWLRGPEGTLLFGYLFYALLAAGVYVAARRLPGTSVPLLWLLGLFLLLEFLPKQWSPFVLSPRYARYAHAFLAPATLIVGAALAHVRGRAPGAVWVAMTVLGASGVVEAAHLHRIWYEPVMDRNEASRYLASLPPKPVYSDFWLTSRLAFDMQYDPTLYTPWDLAGKPFQVEVIEKKDRETLWKIREGYVVTGGSRGIEVGLFSVLNLEGHTPPPNWTLLMEIPRPPGEERLEPLRVWEVRPPPDESPPPERHDASRPGHTCLRMGPGSGYETDPGCEEAS